MTGNAPFKTLRLGRSGKVALVDADDHARLKRWSWWIEKGHVCRKKFPNGSGAMRLSHEVLNLAPHVHVRHLNGDRLDCRRANLQALSGSIKVRLRRRKPYRVTIGIDRMLFHVGYYPTLRTAEAMRQIAAGVAVEVRGRKLTRKQIQGQLDLATGRRVRSGVAVRVQQAEARAA